MHIHLEESILMNKIKTHAFKALSATVLALTFTSSAQAFFTASEMSVMVVASIVVGPSFVAADASGKASQGVKQAMLSLSDVSPGQSLIVKSVHASGKKIVYVIERVGDGASTALEVVASSIAAPLKASEAVGRKFFATQNPTGTLLHENNQVFAFVPNAKGAALTGSEKAQ